MGEPAETIRLVVVDDQPWVRVGLETLLNLEPGLEVVAVLESGEALLAWLEHSKADVVLLDVRMPGLGGIETARRLKKRYPKLPVLLLTTFEDEADMVAGLRVGVSGYVLKDVSVEVLRAAVTRLSQGERYIHPRVSEVLAEALEQAQQPPAVLLDKLTPRETEVLALVAKALSNKRIAEALAVSEGTVKVHVSSILSKLGVADRQSAVATALQLGLLKTQSPFCGYGDEPTTE